jgi:hypothetical protein
VRNAGLFCLLVCVGCAGLPREIVSLAQDTKMGGELAFEVDESGKIIGMDAEVDPSTVPQVCRDAANRHYPGGSVTGAEKEWNGGKIYWEIVKNINGQRFEILMNADGSLAGYEQALRSNEVPAGVVEAARKAVPNGRLVVVERVTGPEAKLGEEYHVKMDVSGEQLRVGVGGGKVVRVVRKIRADFRVPQR